MGWLLFVRSYMDIFQRIEQLSYRIAERIGKGDSEEDVELYKYSVFMMLSNSFTIGVGALLAIGFGYFHVYIPCVITYILLRTVGGGQHCDTFYECFFISNIIISFCCIMAILTEDAAEIMWLISMLVAINTIPICPKPSSNSPSRGKKEDLRFRKSFAFRSSAFIVLSFVFIIIHRPLISTSISAGILVLCFILSDFGERLISEISN